MKNETKLEFFIKILEYFNRYANSKAGGQKMMMCHWPGDLSSMRHFWKRMSWTLLPQ